MNQHLQTVPNLIQQAQHLSADEKNALLKAAKAADKELEITAFKLERTEKVKHTTAILLEETIEELEQKRKAVEVQNYELEIEGALERVRSVAMGMKKPEDMLEVCKTISQQLVLLKLKEIRNVQTAIFYEEKGIYMNYEYYAKHDRLIITETEFRNHPVAEKFANQMMKGPNEIFTHQFTGKAVKEWLEYQKTTNVFIDSYLETASSLNYYWYSLGPVALGASTYVPLNENEIELFKRFRNVFELSYRRYIDIEKAEAQSRESQIQLALERVRARTMAMQKSDELPETAYILYQQFKELGKDPVQITIGIVNETQRVIEFSLTNEGDQMDKLFKAPIDEPIVIHKIYVAWKEQKKSLVIDISGQQLREYNNFRNSLSDIEFNNDILEDRRVINIAFFSKGLISVSYTEPAPPETVQLLERFAKVFGQTYTRFLDLQKAEAQAREAQIEAALERVRRRAMAMQTSQELKEVAREMRTQLSLLGQAELETCAIHLWGDLPGQFEGWAALRSTDNTGELIESESKLDIKGIRILEESFQQYLAGKKDYVLINDFDKAKEFFEALRQVDPKAYAFLAPTIKNKKSGDVAAYWAISDFEGGSLVMVTMKQPAEESRAMLRRFANVFGLAYKRFKDLQIAEAQARESQIQLALERVRARTMAMQKSDELSDAVYVLFQQFKELGEKPDQATIGVVNEDEKVIEYWVTMYGQPINKVFRFSIDEPNVTGKIYKAWKEGKKSLVIDLKGKSLREFMEYRAGKGGATVNPKEKRRIINVAFFSKGLLNVQSNEERSKESIQLLERFASVFEQTYTRFLDLQRAEAQAREAQIEAALEKVRSRTMAMHKQNDLLGVLDLLVEQLLKLGVNLQVANFSNGIPGGDWDLWIEVAADDGTVFNNYVHFPRIEHPYFYNVEKNIETFRKDGTDLFKDVFSKEEKDSWQDYINTHTIYKDLTSEEIKQSMYEKPGYAWSMVILKDTWVSICRFNTIPFTDAEDALLRRFANAFGQAYTRFLDLKKAEVQAREAQIEIGLERVRSRAMSMQSSDELKVLIGTLFTELTKLDLALTRCIIWIFEPAKNDARWWMANSEDAANPVNFYIQYHESPPYLAFVNSWKNQTVKFVYDLNGEEKKQWDDILFNQTELKNLPDFVKDGMLAPDQVILSGSFNNFGAINVASYQPLSEEHFDILLRFAKVFDLTYTRFLDLKNAEAQAREAQIEAALEKVRSRSLAMHKSDELKEVIRMVLEQFIHLNIKAEHAGFYVDYKVHDDMHIWLADPNLEPFYAVIPYFDTPTWNSFLEAKTKGTTLHTDQLDFETKNKFYKSLFKLFTIPEEAKEFYLQCKGLAVSTVLLDNVGLYIENFDGTPYKDDENNILIRFGKVFQQAYTRFLDLQKAEAQAREAQIEAALERVRSRTMAMHNSSELLPAAELLFDQVQQLGAVLQGVAFAICDKDSGMVQKWTSIGVFSHPYNIEPVEERMYEAWKNQGGMYEEVIEGERQKKYYEAFMQIPSFREGIQKFIESGYPLPTWQKNHAVPFKYGYLLFITLKPFNETNIFIRFRKVFEQTYTRFLDLQKAEAQAREARIEASLERVRAKAMAMQNSQDLSDTIGVFYRELKLFSLTPRRCGVGLLDREDRIGEIFTWNTTEQGESLELVGCLKMEGHPVLNKVYEKWLIQEEYHPVLRGNEIKKYYEIVKPQIAFPDYTNTDVQFGYFFFFPEGGVYAWTENEMQEDELQIYRRFTSVLSLTYKRYRDLQKAETNAREAIKQAALDRIRADIASMRTISDLDRITPLIWNELTVLGIPFIRCGVFIMDDEQQLIHTFLSSPDGKAIAAFHLPYDTPGHIGRVLSHWKERNSYIDHWDETTFSEFGDTLVKQGALASSEQYLKTIPQEGFYLHFLPFLQGMLYVGNTAQLGDEDIDLIQSVADAFSTAYARYEDFNKLEAAKKQVDSTLHELQATQKQLIQAEKMASLGELTAGIAHEIQNPLNFVNNFSEVSKELLEEMRSALENGDSEEAREIANDIIQNLEKINHHGKRADAIVKSMLEHSRTNSGVKEPTNINTLADEYLRLSYHGLRAKDKEFNAEIKTEFDESIEKINIIPQDIGRVLLNLFNNAFYAVNERRRNVVAEQNRENSVWYQPRVTVITKNDANSVSIIVSDNGSGIPQKIVDKIFQPFFTTKPTGQGTGLGLSLSYDIVKAHGGEIKVETKEGEGSGFIISLPF